MVKRVTETGEFHMGALSQERKGLPHLRIAHDGSGCRVGLQQ